LQILDLHYNKLKGKLPQLPTSITYFSVAVNFFDWRLTGELVAACQYGDAWTSLQQPYRQHWCDSVHG
jgi:hypothetical protein